MKYLILIALLIVTVSCKHTQSVSNVKESVRVDTFLRYREVIRTVPQRDSIIIFNPCDSSGILSKFYTQISIPNGKVKIQSKGGNIIASVVADESISVNDSSATKQTSKDTSVVEKVVVTNIIPTWIIITLFVESMIILLYLYFKFILV